MYQEYGTVMLVIEAATVNRNSLEEDGVEGAW